MKNAVQSSLGQTKFSINPRVGQATPDRDPQGSSCSARASGKQCGFVRHSLTYPNLTTARGFTLIELLVVVLIIGILAAVALPQYQTAVKKACFGEVQSTLNTFMKAIDLYVLEHGMTEVYFTGPDRTAELDISIPYKTEDRNKINTKIGGWAAECRPERCVISFMSYFDADGAANTNTWLDGVEMAFEKPTENSPWLFKAFDNTTNTSSSTLRLVCSWWKTNYGEDRMLESAATDCANY